MADPEKLFRVNVVTPNGMIYSHRGSIVDVRAVDGERSILYNHTPLLTPLVISEVKVKRSQEMGSRIDHIAISGGYIDFSENVATIIADSAERADLPVNSLFRRESVLVEQQPRKRIIVRISI